MPCLAACQSNVNHWTCLHRETPTIFYRPAFLCLRRVNADLGLRRQLLHIRRRCIFQGRLDGACKFSPHLAGKRSINKDEERVSFLGERERLRHCTVPPLSSSPFEQFVKSFRAWMFSLFSRFFRPQPSGKAHSSHPQFGEWVSGCSNLLDCRDDLTLVRGRICITHLRDS